ncbi:hypothetical protein GRZ55_22525 [Chelativorans sp. ZYF759]|uniref:hypothetical protein n=1 Tax=Chelativorans sp. ZYF759 TaxID=2692213 RepID=UPI00145DB90A|nr:hypothetical protein [Chelativorans sp. ZYF759]NMG42008.1 hypothetical protein [Chelativorans sp. ZYF759]
MRSALKNYLASVAWLATTIFNIARRKPRSFVLSVSLTIVLLVMKFLAMVLPLKVVLLAASEGIPSYTPFIDAEDKFLWIAGLAIGAVVAFVLVQMLESVVKRICVAAGTDLMAKSADMQLVPNQVERTGIYFIQMSSLAADGAFFATGMVLYAILTPLTFAAYLGTVLSSLALGSLFVIVGQRWGLGGLHRAITQHTSAYLSFNSTVIFFICFLVILLPFFAGWELNMLVALISIVLLRRTLSALTGAIATSVKLVASHNLVDALMFREKQLVQVKSIQEQTSESMFAPKKRRELASALLAQGGVESKVDDVIWLDPVVAGTLSFIVHCDDKSCFHLQVYPPSKSHIAMNEEALFAVMGRESLPAPKLIGEMRYGDFICRLLTAGEGNSPAAKDWNSKLRDAVVRIASVSPREDLVAIYSSTRPLPYQTLTDEFIDRVKIALNGKKEQRLFETFKRDLPVLRERIALMPLSIGNSNMARVHSVLEDDGFATFLYWGQWSLEPLGAGVMLSTSTLTYVECLEKLRELRPDLPASLSVADLLTARHVQVLIQCIQKQSFASALETIREIVALDQHRASMLSAAE